MPGRHQLRRRPLHPPVRVGDRLRQSVGVLRRPAQADNPHQAAVAPGARQSRAERRDVHELASGLGNATAIPLLIEGQQSFRRTFLSAVYQAASSHGAVSDTTRTDCGPPGGYLPPPRRRAQLHSTPCWPIRSSGPGPCGVWAAELAPERADLAPGALGADLGYLGALAASAAMRAAVSRRSQRPGHRRRGAFADARPAGLGPGQAEPHGRTPGHRTMTWSGSRPVGRWKLPTGDLLRGDAIRCLAGDDHRTAEWQVRGSCARLASASRVEDTDPYRDCYGPAATSRLSGASSPSGSEAFADAWAEIGARLSPPTRPPSRPG